MNNTLQQLFKSPYHRQSFIDNVLLPTFQKKVSELKIYTNQAVQPIHLTPSEQEYVVSAVKYGEFQTKEETPKTVELYEVIVKDNKQIERSRVALADLVKKHIIGNNAVLVNFAYQNPQKRTWRFSFIAFEGHFFEGQVIRNETNPKRFTYVFGEQEESYKTAIERFEVLANEFEISIDKIKEAFGVEALSKAFFDEYRDKHYLAFVNYLMNSNFKNSVFNGNDKNVRDFVKKLLGRIVFLYFLQKKGWLGATNNQYNDGDKNFMANFFKEAGANEAFYPTWLSKLFFEVLNEKRSDDDFIMPNGKKVKIPYLNGGLFEKESANYDFLTFPTDLFANLFAFFNQYNFTIFEDSPNEHTVAVDPEMLGHIFENLLEDNKDKGAFYTPKEIVHYMTQESLIEYLYTKIPDIQRVELENFVKNKEHQLSKEFQKQIDQQLDIVKICDPAIGSGAFPMGLLQEIFGLKERIAYELGYEIIHATVKENIIQHSIYGVDIEKGAVDIARLRFWLSLIVDEEKPKALPNLDYKIVVGNSLVSKFDDTVIEIDWSDDTAKEGLFGQFIAEEKKHFLKEISKKQAQYFVADNLQKITLNKEIRNLKLDILIKELELIIKNKGFKSQTMQGLTNKQIEAWQQTQNWEKSLKKLQKLKENPSQPFQHFDWKLDFPEVLNPFVFSQNENIKNLNLQISALNKQIEVINHHLHKCEKILSVLHFQANIAQGQVDLIKLQIEKIEQDTKSFFGNIYKIDNEIVSDIDDSIVYKVSSINNGIRHINNSVSIINTTIAENNPNIGFDIVIGNPPYVSAPTMVKSDSKTRDLITKTKKYSTLYQKWDLYIPFMELGLILLKNDAVFSMIVPYPLTNQNYAMKLRELIVNQYDLKEIVDLNGTKIFQNATVSNCIPFVSKSKSTNTSCYISTLNDDGKIEKSFLQNFKDLIQDKNTLIWNLTSQKRETNKHSNMKVLGDYCYISVGMVLNADEKKAKGEFTKDDLISESCDEIHCRKYIEAKDIEKYNVKKVRYLEYNTLRVPNKLRRPTFRELYEKPKLMFNRLGSLQVYLDDKIKFLHSDSMYSAVLWKDLVEVENKSISGSIKKYSNYTREEMEVYSQNMDLSYLLAILNSNYASILLSHLRAGDYHIYPEHIRNIPIPKISIEKQEIFVKKVNQILEKKAKNEDTKTLEQEIDNLVYKLYELTYEEVKVIDPAFSLSEEAYKKIELKP